MMVIVEERVYKASDGGVHQVRVKVMVKEQVFHIQWERQSDLHWLRCERGNGCGSESLIVAGASLENSLPC